MGDKYKCLSKKTVENVQINSVWPKENLDFQLNDSYLSAMAKNCCLFGQGIFRIHKMSCIIFFFFTTTDGMLYRMNSKYTMSKIILLLSRPLKVRNILMISKFMSLLF